MKDEFECEIRLASEESDTPQHPFRPAEAKLKRSAGMIHRHQEPLRPTELGSEHVRRFQAPLCRGSLAQD
jgi:hypothetical protein